MNERGQYGVQRRLLGETSLTTAPTEQAGAWSVDDPLTWGVVGGGIGMLLGVVIGSKLTFHTPVRRRSSR